MEKEKEALERKIEDLESTNNNNNEAYKPIDMFRVSNFYLLVFQIGFFTLYEIVKD